MNLANKIINFLKSANTDDQAAHEGMCLNCWGRTEYSGNFYEAMKNENISINDTDSRVGWIQQYANEHLSAIELRTTNEATFCQKYKVCYTESGT